MGFAFAFGCCDLEWLGLGVGLEWGNGVGIGVGVTCRDLTRSRLWNCCTVVHRLHRFFATYVYTHSHFLPGHRLYYNFTCSTCRV